VNDLLDKIANSVTAKPEKKEEKLSPVQQVHKPVNLFSDTKFLAKQRAKVLEDSKNTKKRNYFRASELGDCSIQLYCRLRNDPQDYSRVGKNHFLPMMAHVGNAIHDFVQKNYDFSHVEYAINSDKYHIHARVDGVIDSNVLVEIKTLSDCKFLRQKDVMQLGANYLLLKEKGFDILSGQLVYIERTLTRMATYDFIKLELEHYAKEVVQKTKLIFECLEKEEPPTSFLNKKNCPWCEYHHICPENKLRRKKNET